MIISSRKWKNDRQYNGQKENSYDRQNTAPNIKNWVRRIPLKPGVNSDAPEEEGLPAPLVARVILFLNLSSPLGFVRGQTCCSTRTHEPDTDSTSLCSYSLILCI